MFLPLAALQGSSNLYINVSKHNSMYVFGEEKTLSYSKKFYKGLFWKISLLFNVEKSFSCYLTPLLESLTSRASAAALSFLIYCDISVRDAVHCGIGTDVARCSAS